MKPAMEAIQELKKSKRELKSAITRALNDLAIRLAAKEPDCTQISTGLEHIEGKKEEALAIMRDLETEFDKIKKTEEAEKIGDEADALVDRVDKETNTARSYLAAQVKMSSSKQQGGGRNRIGRREKWPKKKLGGGRNRGKK